MNPAFERAIKMTETIYTHAVIHCVAEKVDSVWHNLYTSAIYGREIDLLSVPTYVEHEEYGQQLLCLRVRVSREEAARLFAAARAGAAVYSSWEIRYAIEETIEGFRPATGLADLTEASFWERSLWGREGIGARKKFGGEQLGTSNAWRVSEYLTCLEEERWAPIPLAFHPEKLGDLDEIHPSPISVSVGNEDGASAIRVSSLDPSLLARETVTLATLTRDDLIIRTLFLVGAGPLRFEEEFNGMSVLTTVDGVPMDGQANWFMRSISMNITTYGNERLHIPADGRRKELHFPIPHRQSVPNSIGTPRRNEIRHQAWVAGRLFRSQIQPADAEHFYNPVADSGASVRAYYDLQHYGKEQRSPEVVVADPYALDERSMHAMAVMALRENRVPHIDVLTQFDSGASGSVTAPCTAITKRNRQESTTTQRAAAMESAKAVAQKIATELKVTMSFYRTESLHDRFLLVGDRLWHVGCSFNQLGQEITATVEMRDTRVKYAVVKMFNAVRNQAPVFKVQP